jgi:hypothetical protein
MTDRLDDIAIEPPSIRFPAFSFAPHLFTVINSIGAINKCTKLGFKNGFYRGLILVDSDGKKFEALSARRIRTLVSSPKQLFGLLSFNPYWQVEILFSPASRKVSVDEVKRLILDSFQKERHLWEEMCDFEDFQNEISLTSSLDQIFDTFKKFNRI